MSNKERLFGRYWSDSSYELFFVVLTNYTLFSEKKSGGSNGY